MNGRSVASAWAASMLAAAWGVAIFLVPAGKASALTPDSPEVRAALAKAVKFLESDEANDTRLGARALVGLVLLKYGAPADHPKITAAADAIVRAVANKEATDIKIDLYSTGLAIIFLVTLDPSKYHNEIILLLKSYEVRQKPHGGWGYPEGHQHAGTGDTSMTQYAVLSAWEAAQVGFTMSQTSLENVAIWLLKTQDPSGGFGYQGNVSDDFTPVKQSGVKHSMVAAGMGSLYICADLLGLGSRPERRDDLPVVFREVKVKAENPEQEEVKTKVDPRILRAALNRGNVWLRTHFNIEPPGWTHYYLYALERYWSFRELAEGRSEKEPRWYNEGARMLIRTQAENGSWNSKSGPTADTAFGALFLLRSSKKSIEKARSFNAGVMVVGHGLPRRTDAVEVRLGRVVVKSDRDPTEELMALLDRPEHADFARALDAIEEMPLEQIQALTAQHFSRLEGLSRHSSALARLAAVRALGRVRNLDHAPVLIRALADSNAEVAAEARAGLLRLSRRTDEAPTQPANELQRRDEIARWKAWLLAVRPDAEVSP